jgi:iron complex outermembrane receptor protein
MLRNPALKLAPLTAAVIAATAIPSMSLAQGSSATLEEVVVTAQRRETLLQDTPIAVTAFGAEKIADLGIYDISDVGDFVPNTNIRKQPSSNSNMSIVIRGVGSGETSLMVDPKTSFYLDGVYMSKTVGAVFDVVDLQSVEVLRGPQGTLFGRNSTGGAVNVTTVKPSGEFGFKLEGSMGNDGYQRWGGSVDTPKLFDMLSAKFSGMLMEYDGWADNSYSGPEVGYLPAGFQTETDLASEDNESYRIALRLEPTDSFTVDYAYDKTDNEGVPTPFQITKVKDSIYNGITTVPFPYTFLGGQLYQEMAATVGDPTKRREDWNLEAQSTETLEVEGHSLTMAWDVGPFLLKYIFADRETESGYASTDLDGGALSTADLFYGGGQVIPTPGFVAAIDEGWIDLQTHELQIIGEAFNDRLQYTAGYFYYDEEVYQSNPQTFGLPIQFLVADPGLLGAYTAAGFCNDFGTGPVCIGSQRLPLPFPFPRADPNLNGRTDFIYGQETESWAVYGQGTYSLTDSLDLTAGLRYTEDDREAFLFNESLGHTSIDDRFTNSDTWDNVSYLLTLNWAMSDDVNLYFTHSTGYNGGGFNSRASTISSWESVIEEEEISSFEFGAKTEWWDSRVRANVALFYNEYDDIQTAQFEAGTGGASSRIVNAGKATFQGLELDLVALLTERLMVDVTYGYLDAEYDEYLQRDPATDQQIDISNVTTMPRAPEHTANLGLQYDLPLGDFGLLSSRLDVAYMDSMVFHPFQNAFDSAEDRTLVNLRVSLQDIGIGDNGRLRISAWTKNLTDEEYREWGIDFGSLGYAGDTFGRARTYGLDVVYQFN